MIIIIKYYYYFIIVILLILYYISIINASIINLLSIYYYYYYYCYYIKGNDKNADEFLNKLDNNLKNLGAKFDIVDTVTSSTLKSIDFVTFIKKSIQD